MPIKIIAPQLAAGGRVKIGRLSNRQIKPGMFLPTKIDHFILTHMDRDLDDAAKNFRVHQEVMAALESAGYADQDGRVRTIPIMLHSDDVEQVFRHHLEFYRGKRLNCQGDGETAKRWEFKDGKRLPQAPSQVQCVCRLHKSHPEFVSKPGQECKPHATLSFVLDLPGVGVSGAVWQWQTTSEISVARMLGSIGQIKSLAGCIRGLPLLMRVQPVQTQHGESYVCHLELREGVLQSRALAPSHGEVTLSIPEPTEMDEADTAEEFYPEVTFEPVPEPEPTKGVAALMGKL